MRAQPVLPRGTCACMSNTARASCVAVAVAATDGRRRAAQAVVDRIRGECRKDHEQLKQEVKTAQQEVAIKASLAESWQREVQGLCKRLEQVRRSLPSHLPAYAPPP